MSSFESSITYDPIKSKELLTTIDPYHFKLLLHYNANPNHTFNTSEDTLLHLCRDYELIMLLLDAKANPDSKNRYYESPLHLVKDYNIAKALLDYKANPNRCNRNNQTPLYYINDYNIVQLLLLYNANPNHIAIDMKTPLHTSKSIDIIRLLIQYQANINAICSIGTPLCVHIRNKDIVSLLLHSHADPCITGPNKQTPLLLTYTNHDNDDVNTSINHVNCNNDNNYNNNNDNNEIIHLLLQHKANPNDEDSAGYTLFYKTKSLYIIQLLIQYNIDIKSNKVFIRDHNNTYLHRKKMLTSDIIRLLSTYNADINSINIHHDTPLHIIDNYQCILTLLELKCDITKRNWKGQSVLYNKYEHNSIIAILDYDAIISKQLKDQYIYDKIKHQQLQLFQGKQSKDGEMPVAISNSNHVNMTCIVNKYSIEGEKSVITLLDEHNTTPLGDVLSTEDQAKSFSILHNIDLYGQTIIFNRSYNDIILYLQYGIDSNHYDTYKQTYLHYYFQSIYNCISTTSIQLHTLFNLLPCINSYYIQDRYQKRYNTTPNIISITILIQYISIIYKNDIILYDNIYQFIQYGAYIPSNLLPKIQEKNQNQQSQPQHHQFGIIDSLKQYNTLLSDCNGCIIFNNES